MRFNADVNRAYEEKNGAPPFVAPYFGHTSIVQIPIDAGAGLDVESTGEGTALKVAIDKGHEGVKEMLRKAGAKGHA